MKCSPCFEFMASDRTQGSVSVLSPFSCLTCSAAHEKRGWAEAAAGSRAQGSAASPAGEARGSQALAAGAQFVREWRFYSLNPWKVMGVLQPVSLEVQHTEEVYVSLQDKVNQGRVSVSRWTLVLEQNEGFFSSAAVLVSCCCLSKDQGHFQSVQCSKSILVCQGGDDSRSEFR